jgi:transcriptional regulator with XRE-family HTH domain
MASLRERFGKRCRDLRKAAGLTQEELARRAGLDWKYLGSIERGERNLTIDNIEKIVKGLDVAPYEPFLFHLKEPRSKGNLDEGALMNLIRRADPSVRPVLVDVVGSFLQWAQQRKKR